MRRMLRMNNRGVALVEFAIVAVLLVMMVIGIIDICLLMKDYTTLSNAAREGARVAAMGSSAEDVEQMVIDSAPTLEAARITVNSYYRQKDVNGWPAEWTTGTPDGISASNSVQVKVRAAYSCNRVSGTLLGSNPVNLSTEAVRGSTP